MAIRPGENARSDGHQHFPRWRAMQKQAVIKLLDQMPGEIDADELRYQLYVPRKLEIAERDVAT
jgi:hypothetical protein